MESRMADFEEKVEMNLQGVEERLKADIREQAAKAEISMRDMHVAMTKLLGEHRDEIRTALHKGELTFQSLATTTQAHDRAAELLATKVAAVEVSVGTLQSSSVQRAISEANSAAAAVAAGTAIIVNAKPSAWEKYIAPNVASGLVALVISAIIGGGGFILKAQWENERMAEIRKTEEIRAAESRQVQALAELLKGVLAKVPAAPSP